MSASGQKLIRVRLSAYRALGSYGYPSYVSHGQLMALLAAQGLPHLQPYFAQPTLEPDKKHLRYSVDLPGAVQRLAELKPAQQGEIRRAMAEIRLALDDCVERLRSSMDSGGMRLIENARRVPAVPDAAGEFMRVVGGQPVICCWGFEDPFRGGVDHTAAEFLGGGTSPDDEAVEALPLAPPATSVAPAPVRQEAPVHRPAASPRGKPPAAQPHAKLPAAQPRPKPPAAPARAKPTAGRRRLHLPAARWWLWAALALPVLAVVAWLVMTFTTLGPLGFDDDGTPRVKGRRAAAVMSIPAGALERGDLTFLEGVWQLGAERLPTYRGVPDNVIGSHRLVVHFKKQGEGRVFGLEREYGGKPAPGCSGTATARAVGRKLYFETLQCVEKGGGGRNLIGSRHECTRQDDGRAACRSAYIDGQSWDGTPRVLR